MASYKYDPIKNITKHYDNEGNLKGSSIGDTTSTNGVVATKGYVKPVSDTVTITDGTKTLTVTPDMAGRYYEKGWSNGTGSSANSSSGNTTLANSYADDLYQAKLKSTLSALDKSRSSQLGALSTERSTIQPYYQQAGLQARGQSGQGARSFSDYLASRGLSSSGVAAQGEINRMGTLQGTLGNLGQQEVQAMSGIAQRESDVNNAYSSDVASAKAGNQAEMLAQKIQQQRYKQERNDKLKQQGVENELKKTEYTDTKTANERSSFLDTIGQYSNDFTAQKNAILNDGDPTNDWQAGYLAAEANSKKSRAEEQYQKQGFVSEDIRAALGLPVGTMTEAYKKKMEQAMQNEQVDNTLKIFAQTGYLTAQMAAILKAYGLPTDTATLNALKTQYSTNKPYYKPEIGGSNKPWYLQ